MLYHFEIQMLGIILLPVMLASGIFLWLKRRKANQEFESEESQNL